MRNLPVKFVWAAVCCLWTFMASAQSTSVTGMVKDQASGEPIIGANIMEQGTSNGTITDVDGTFVLSVQPNAILEVSYIGYTTQSVEVDGRASIVVELQEDAVALQEVVAIGYGSQKKKEVTGSVASVKAENFNPGVKTNPIGLLQGKVAGLNISRSGGDPTNTGYNIQIRGFSTLDKGAGTSPLYIVDGIPVNNIDNIAPTEIASMDVLKDGSAAAIYGTRGTNGVIIITTKRGEGAGNVECGKAQVEYSGYVSLSQASGNTGMATIDEYRNLEALSGGKVKPVDMGASTDWMAEMLRTAPITHNHNVAITGATKNFSYRGSVAFKDAQGIAKNSDRDEIIAKFAADQKLLDGWVNLQYDFSYMHYKNNYFCGDFKQAATLNPTYPIYDADNAVSGYFIPNGSGQSNPVASLNQKESYQEGNYFRGSVRATVDIKPVPGLKVSGFAALEEGDNYSYWYNSLLYDTSLGDAGMADRKTDRSLNQLYEATLDYAGQWGAHALTAVAGFSYQKFFYDGSEMKNGGFAVDDNKYYMMENGLADKSKMTMSSYRNDNVLVSGFARVNYNYDEKYLLSASIRREGSSRFGANHKWGWFPAVSAGWRISGEDFMANADWVNDLKLRAGFGITGNNLGSDLKSVELLTNGGAFWYNGQWVTTYMVNQNANPDLRWERKFEYNVGVDFAFLDNRLSGSIDAYLRHTKDLLWEYDVPTPPYQFNKLLANAGAIKSQGLEIALTGVPVQRKHFDWTSTLTIAFNKNIITKLSDPELGLNYSSMLSGGVGENGLMNVNTQRIEEGQPVGTFYGYKWTGQVTTGGNLVYEKDEYGRDKMQVIGHAQPLFTYGWNNTFRYKNWDFSLFFRGVVGNDVLNVKRWAYAPSGTSAGTNVFMKEVEAMANGTGVKRQGVFSDYYLEDGSYIKLDNLTVGYTLPVKPNKFVQSFRVYATGENLFSITGYSGIDPEINTSSVWESGIDATGFYPFVRNFLIGINVTFN